MSKSKIKHWWLASEVDNVETLNTGGNVLNDILTLKDDSLVVITSDGIYYFKNRQDYEENLEIGFINRYA